MSTESQTYLSTRGGAEGVSFGGAVLKGLADDGGLFIPTSIPTLPTDWKTRWRDLSFQELAFEIMSLYISESEISSADLKKLIEKSYGTFRDSSVTPVVRLNGDKSEEAPLYLLELFHGPTFAFKDVALQFVGNLFEYLLKGINESRTVEKYHLPVVGATSGDTGSAAIYGLRGKENASIFILYPEGLVSPIQEAQMTTVLDENVHTISVQGYFDDCQDTVKALFARQGELKNPLAAVNSINWARILAQMTYYFASYFSVVRSQPADAEVAIRYVVPSGNFGDILAGWFSKRMGLPVEKLVIATNENDILDRFFKQDGSYSTKSHPVRPTLSPAMDILVSSNFERLLWFLAAETAEGENLTAGQRRAIASEQVRGWLADLKSAEKRGFQVTPAVIAAARAEFESERVSDLETVDTIKHAFSDFGGASLPGQLAAVARPVVLDPHSAIGVCAAERSMSRTGKHVHHISLATAHPAKFVDAVERAVGGQSTLVPSDKPGEGLVERTYSYPDMVEPAEFVGLAEKERRVIRLRRPEGVAAEDKEWIVEAVLKIIKEKL